MEEIEVTIYQDHLWLTDKFVGKYRRDLEKENWHYYEDDAGQIRHYKKSAMVRVISKKVGE